MVRLRLLHHKTKMPKWWAQFHFDFPYEMIEFFPECETGGIMHRIYNFLQEFTFTLRNSEQRFCDYYHIVFRVGDYDPSNNVIVVKTHYDNLLLTIYTEKV